MKEEWKDVPGYPHYQASSLGRLRSIDRHVKIMGRWGYEVTRHHKSKILKPWVNKRGYNYTSLGDGNRKETHYWIAISFLGPKPPGKETNHKNGNKSDNTPQNLEWVTRQENVKHSFSTGLNHYWAKHGISKLDETQVTEIKHLLAGKKKRQRPYYSEIADKYGVDRKTIESIAKNKTWRAV